MTEGVISGVIGGLVVTLFLLLVSWAKEKSRQKHESRMALRDEHIRAYGEVLKTTSGVDAKDRRTIGLGISDMLRAVSVAQMVTGGNKEILDSLEELREAWNSFREEAEGDIRAIDEQEIEERKKENKRCRDRFLEAAWKQTGTSDYP